MDLTDPSAASPSLGAALRYDFGVTGHRPVIPMTRPGWGQRPPRPHWRPRRLMAGPPADSAPVASSGSSLEGPALKQTLCCVVAQIPNQ
ncbi:hypothetical protein NL676_034550 [Syzygium grande]|nr:hypothetical protein NL676_034550 [Syzygium grande]